MLGWIAICANHWDVDPEFAMAVAHIESRLPGRQEFRLGKIGHGTFYGPFGIHKCFKKRWPIDRWPVNVYYGCRALRGVQTEAQARRRLKSYNAEFDRDYWLAVKRAWEKYEEEWNEN